MSGLSPERREELAKALRGVPIGPFGPNALTVISTGGTTHLNSSERADLADTIAPLVADMLAAEREAGAAEVRARVEAAVDRRCLRLQHTGGNGICLPCHGLGAALLADLNGGE